MKYISQDIQTYLAYAQRADILHAFNRKFMHCTYKEIENKLANKLERCLGSQLGNRLEAKVKSITRQSFIGKNQRGLR